MDRETQIKALEDQGKKWLAGQDLTEWQIGDKHLKFSPKQQEFINAKDRYVLFSGGFGCGKSTATYVKLAMMCLFFPNNRILLGKRTLSELEKIVLPELFDIIPKEWVHHNKKTNILTFFNGSEIILLGLDAMQSGTNSDIKKAEQAIKGLNLGGAVLDQLEEIELKVWEAVRHRLRRDVPLVQVVMNTNPADYWAYKMFKEEPADNCRLVEGSMIDNEANLPPEYIKDQLSKDDDYVQRYVYGVWERGLFTEGQVFAKEHVNQPVTEPIREFEGGQVFKEPVSGHDYQMGLDPSEGLVDPAAIIIVDTMTGEVVFTWRDFVPPHVISDRAIMFAKEYNDCLVVPERNGNGAATMEHLKVDYDNIYLEEVFGKFDTAESTRLGFNTNVRTKRMLIDNMLDLLRRKVVRIYDKRITREMETFIWSDEARKKGAGASNGEHDDMIMAMMMAFHGVKPIINGYQKSPEELKQTQPIVPVLDSYA